MSKSFAVSPEINLIGMTVDEALAHLDKYLDDASLAHLPSVRIVHGKGTGALRNAVHNYLRKNKVVNGTDSVSSGKATQVLRLWNLKSNFTNNTLYFRCR